MTSTQRTFLWCILCVFALAMGASAVHAKTIGPNAIAPGETWSHTVTGTGDLKWHIHPTGAMYGTEVVADTDGTTRNVTVEMKADGDEIVFEPAEPVMEQGDTIEFVNRADSTQDLMVFAPTGDRETTTEHSDHSDHDHDHDAGESPGPGALAAVLALGALALVGRRR